MMRTRGNRRFRFGRFEAKATLDWRGIAWTITSTTVAWGLAEVVPYLDSQAGWIGATAGLAAIALRGAREWLRDNEGFTR